MNMLITEEERKEILSKYKDDTSDELLTYLKRHFPVHEFKGSFMSTPIKFIQIDDKQRPLTGNKKFLVSKLSNIVEEEWISLGVPKIRRTVKKYLDGIKLT